MRTLVRTAGRLVTVALLVLAAAQDCSKFEGTRKNCDTRPTAPSAQWSGQTFISAATSSTCDVAPQAHHVYLYLEEKMGEVWAERGNLLCTERPTGGVWIRCELVRYECHPGTWRTRVLVTGTNPDGTTMGFEPERPETLITSCPTGE